MGGWIYKATKFSQIFISILLNRIHHEKSIIILLNFTNHPLWKVKKKDLNWNYSELYFGKFEKKKKYGIRHEPYALTSISDDPTLNLSAQGLSRFFIQIIVALKIRTINSFFRCLQGGDWPRGPQVASNRAALRPCSGPRQCRVQETGTNLPPWAQQVHALGTQK